MDPFGRLLGPCPTLLDCSEAELTAWHQQAGRSWEKCGRQHKAVLEPPADTVEGFWDFFYRQDSLKGFPGREGSWVFYGALES